MRRFSKKKDLSIGLGSSVSYMSKNNKKIGHITNITKNGWYSLDNTPTKHRLKDFIQEQ